MTLLRVGIEAATTAEVTGPQLQFFENFPGHLGASFVNDAAGSVSVHAVNIPLSISLNTVVYLFSNGAGGAGQSRTLTVRFGLYSLNGSTLSLANSGSVQWTYNSVSRVSWISLTAFSSAQNITPGAWYFAFNKSGSGDGIDDFYLGNSSVNPGNGIPGGFLMGHMTVSTGNMPASIATSELDITGSDATRQPYIIITA